MKIAIVKESLCLGGTERSAANISVALSEKHDVDVILYDGSQIQYKFGGNLFDMGVPVRGSKISKVVDHIRRLRYFRGYLHKERPDIVFLFISFRHPIGKMPMKKAVKLISARDFSVLSTNIIEIKKRLDDSDGLVCNSEYMKGFFLSKYPEDQFKVFAVKNIIDVYDIQKQGNKSVEDEDFITFRDSHDFLIVSVGRFCAEKAFENLITAFSKCRDENQGIGLVLIGDGEYKGTYLRLIQEYGLTNDVYFTGFQSNPYQYMNKCDLFVLSSMSEGFPNVLAEAMALSKPVISVNCFSGPAEILLKKPNYDAVDKTYLQADYGILTPHYNKVGTEQAISELSKAILFMLNEKSERERYAHLAYERAQEFSSEAALTQFEKIFMQVKSSKQKR